MAASPLPPPNADSANGVASGVVAYALWGFLPIYWKLLQAVPSVEVLCHRMVWALAFLLLLSVWRDRGRSLREMALNPAVLRRHVVTAILVSGNWYAYIWAVQRGRIVDTSLGYFLSPLLTMALGIVLLSERLRRAQWVAVGCAAAGVIWLSCAYGEVPALAVFLAVTFALYTLLRKTSPAGAIDGLALETILLFPLAIGWLGHLHGTGVGSMFHLGRPIDLLLFGGGVATSLPLLLFAFAARHTTMVTLGLLQYLAPTMQFLIGIFLYHEPFNLSRLAGFAFIWIGIAIFTRDAMSVRDLNAVQR